MKRKELVKTTIPATSEYIHIYGNENNIRKIEEYVEKLRNRIKKMRRQRDKAVANRVLRAFNFINSLTPKKMIALSKIINLGGKSREEEMLYLRTMGVTLQSIGKKYGLSRQRVRQITDGLLTS